jgi:GDP-L-fucose synthase
METELQKIHRKCLRCVMNKDSRIYVAGHNGLVGSAIVRKLQEEGYQNIEVAHRSYLDLRNQDDVKEYFSMITPEYVFLAAAKVGGINYNATNPAEFIYDNLMIQNNVIESARLFKTKKLLFLGSACIYPKVTPQPIKEEYLLSSPLEPTNDGYALAKIAGLTMCKYYRKQYGFNAISLMPANLYGPNDNFNPEKCHVIPGMINKFYKMKKEGYYIDNGGSFHGSVELWGDGSPTREFLYVDDLADACLFLMQNYDSPDHINVGSGAEITIKDLANIIKDKIEFPGDIVWDTSKPNGTPRRKLDSTKLFEMGWRPKVPFEEGLKNTIDWFIENKDVYGRI